MRPFALPGLALAAALALAACGGKQAAAPPATTAATPATTPSSTAATTTGSATTTGGSASALQAEATSAATGDIPDNQVFIVFRDPKAGYSMKYPEGWAQRGNAGQVTIRDKNNIVRVVVASGPSPTVASVRSQLSSLRGAKVVSTPKSISVGGGPAVAVVYSTQSAPNSVTGKRVTLLVDRYYHGQAGKEAIIDLGTPKGVDDVDAYRLMIESFRWR